MADIGSTLREARMRERIDITTVESATKIRAKYLRALENEEWDQLPGPTFVRTFLRTYAEYLGLDPKVLVEEYKQRFERPAPQDLMPFSTRSGGGRKAPRPPRVIPPWVVIGGFVILLLVALFALGTIGGDDEPEREAVATPAATATPKAKGNGKGGGKQKAKRKEPAPDEVAVKVIPEAEVYVCLEDGDGEVLIAGEILTEETETYRAPRMRVTFGNGQVSMRFNGKRYEVEDSDVAVGYELVPGKEPRDLPEDELPDLHVSLRAGVIVTGTEVLSGIVTDRNGPWLSERLREQGVECAEIIIVGDRPADVRSALDQLAGIGVDLIVTSGGLGPTADDLTAQVVAEFAGRPLALDEALEGRIWAILEGLTKRWPDLDEGAIRAANRKQALVPDGATVLEPVGTAPGLVIGSRPPVPAVVVLPGPPRELQPMWETALATEVLADLLGDAGGRSRGMLRIFGIPESEIARTLEMLPAEGVALDDLEITTCLRRGEIEVATVYGAAGEDAYARFVEGIRAHHGDLLFSEDGSTVDEQVAGLLLGARATVAVAESCTGGLMAGRLTELSGSSAYVLGGLTVYSNEAKVRHAGVPAEVIERHGAVSDEVAVALADGARAAFGADYGVGITGIAGPGGGSEEKPVGTVCFSVAGPRGRLDRRLVLPGGRADVRERSTTVAMHLLRRLLQA